MRNLFLFSLFVAVTLYGCGGAKAPVAGSEPAKPSQVILETTGVKVAVANNEQAKATQAIVEKWIAAHQKRDAQALLSLYSNDVRWNDCSGATCVPYTLAALKGYVPRDFNDPGFKQEFQSYLVTTSGRFAVVQVTFSQPGVGVPNPTPATAILEIKDGTIINETWFWTVL